MCDSLMFEGSVCIFVKSLENKQIIFWELSVHKNETSQTHRWIADGKAASKSKAPEIVM